MITRRSTRRPLALALALPLAALLAAAVQAQSRPETPRIDSVVADATQPHERDPAVIWFDDFDDDARQDLYGEKSGDTTADERFGAEGKSLEMRYAKGKRGAGGRKVFFGDSPTYRNKTQRRDETFTDVYWRVYVKHQAGWTGGGPAKLSRATSLVPPGWRQAMIAHVWSSGEALTLDPASGVRGGEVVTTKYNDFDKLRWLGNRPASRFQIHSTEESGRWVCVEARAKLNTPGKKDGLNQLWIDGRLEAERRDLDWRGEYTGHGINAVFLEAYWNAGSPVDQSRWLDNFVVSTAPIGPVVTSHNPTLLKTPYAGSGAQQAWEVEVASDDAGEDVVWRSRGLSTASQVTVDAKGGEFTGSRKGTKGLTADTVHFTRVRQQSDGGAWSEWSAWHQPFRTAKE